jgi:23S rRNA (adenine2503-C2)-methyltransferase
MMLQLETSFVEKTPLERYVAPEKPSLIGLSRAELSQALGALGVPAPQRKMRVQQLWHWIYFRGVTSFDAMSSVSKELRAQLAAHHTLDRPEVVAEQVSVDGTRKWLLRLPGEVAGERPHEVECVYIPDSERGTLCVSSQVGCTLNCSFCHTGTQRLVRNLTAGEIVGQVMAARDRLGDWPTSIPPAKGEGGEPTGPREARPDDKLREPGGVDADIESDPTPPAFAPLGGRPSPSGGGMRKITNIVMMGMGEPLYNFEAVRDAILIMADGDGIGISKRRITLSTSGVVPMIERAGREIGCMLAVSLHAVRDALRNELVPLNRKYGIAELLEACRSYPGVSNAKRITFEYVMLKGVNDSIDDAKALVRLLKGIPAKINLIPFNPWPGSRYECSDWEQIEKFSQVVFDAGYASPVRTPRGRDILAACGQLKSASEKLSARERMALRAMVMTD